MIENLIEHTSINNPILTVEDVEPIVAKKFVADPFVIEYHDKYYMFFEICVGGDLEFTIEKNGNQIDLLGLVGTNINNRRYNLSYLISVMKEGISGLRAIKREGIIGIASSDDGVKWRYEGRALSENTHLAYPYVFSHDGDVYMTPDKGGQVNEFRIYRATDFPHEWSLVETPIKKPSLSDPTLLQLDGVWYCFFSGNNGTSLYYSPQLINGDWSKHPDSPISTSDHSKRPAGRPIKKDDSIHFFFQDCENGYGTGINEYKIVDLSTQAYEHRRLTPESVKGGAEWNRDGIHHIDAALRQQGLVVMDGHTDHIYSIGLFEMS